MLLQCQHGLEFHNCNQPTTDVTDVTEHIQLCNSDVYVLDLQDKGRVFRESFLNKLSLLLRGTVAAPSDRFGETLEDEHLRGGRSWDRIAATCIVSQEPHKL